MWDVNENSAEKGGVTSFGGQGAVAGVLLLLHQLPLENETKFLPLTICFKEQNCCGEACCREVRLAWSVSACYIDAHSKEGIRRGHMRVGNYGKLATTLASRQENC